MKLQQAPALLSRISNHNSCIVPAAAAHRHATAMVMLASHSTQGMMQHEGFRFHSPWLTHGPYNAALLLGPEAE